LKRPFQLCERSDFFIAVLVFDPNRLWKKLSRRLCKLTTENSDYLCLLEMLHDDTTPAFLNREPLLLKL
jgi:hypothetical protein